MTAFTLELPDRLAERLSALPKEKVNAFAAEIFPDLLTEPEEGENEDDEDDEPIPLPGSMAHLFKTGADAVEYLKANNLIGWRKDTEDSVVLARKLRRMAESERGLPLINDWDDLEAEANVNANEETLR